MGALVVCSVPPPSGRSLLKKLALSAIRTCGLLTTCLTYVAQLLCGSFLYALPKQWPLQPNCMGSCPTTSVGSLVGLARYRPVAQPPTNVLHSGCLTSRTFPLPRPAGLALVSLLVRLVTSRSVLVGAQVVWKNRPTALRPTGSGQILLLRAVHM